MKHTAPYKEFPGPQGAKFFAPVLNVQISRLDQNAPRTKRFEVRIDSGASCCVFHFSIGAHIGLDLKSGELERTMGISGVPSDTYLHDILLYVPGGPVRIRAAFCDNLPLGGLLGMDGFFSNFRLTFDPTAKHCELERVHQT